MTSGDLNLLKSECRVQVWFHHMVFSLVSVSFFFFFFLYSLNLAFANLHGRGADTYPDPRC